jgi:hypothetical protein
VVVAIGALVGSDAITVMEIAVFAILWVALGTYGILFAPKMFTLFQTAKGLIPDRLTDDAKHSHSFSKDSHGAAH